MHSVGTSGFWLWMNFRAGPQNETPRHPARRGGEGGRKRTKGGMTCEDVALVPEEQSGLDTGEDAATSVEKEWSHPGSGFALFAFSRCVLADKGGPNGI